MFVRLVKVFFGILLISSLVSEIKERYVQHQVDVATFITFIIVFFLCLLLIHSGIVNKGYKYYYIKPAIKYNNFIFHKPAYNKTLPGVNDCLINCRVNNIKCIISNAIVLLGSTVIYYLPQV
jgi:hypothetical protein